MYGAYNSDTLTGLLDTVHRMHNISTWKEKTFLGNFNQLIEAYKQQDGVQNYAINFVLFLTIVREKYAKLYKRFIEELKSYSEVIRVLSKGYLPISLLPPQNYRKF